MLKAIYKPGGEHNVWGVKAHIKQIHADEVEGYLADGWLDHPGKLINPPEPEPEPEPEDIKPAKKGSKAAPDADSDEG